ncbi:MAG TPA: 5-methyltetrahydropteroyltriglutamate--homocysteine S-methyltransferase [Xanthobacteraceae bacterium]|nr:5-methyltetrahydropteroyltriglutamate--homocysteine S-methyltransferase [Xanthobacteraceae bacterium]
MAGKRSTPPFYADQVGSLLRPTVLREAREKAAKGDIPKDALREIEDREISRIVRKQEEVGLQGITDGEFRRFMWHKDFIEGLDGIVSVNDEAPVSFMGIQVHPINLRAVDKIGFSTHPQIEHFKFLKEKAKATAKTMIPSPSAFAPLKLPDRQDAKNPAYPDLEKLYDDLGAAYHDAIKAFHAAGCRYLQIDEVRMVSVADPTYIPRINVPGMTIEGLTKIFAGMLERVVRDRPADMTISMHTCRGNFRSRWAATGGYEPVAEAMFNIKGIDAYFMEYDSDRAGGFEPLRFLPKDKVVVLGLITSKTPQLEDKDVIKRRIDQAAKYVDLGQLRLSPQCGFASTEEGNEITENDQWRKLALVVEIGREVWR